MGSMVEETSRQQQGALQRQAKVLELLVEGSTVAAACRAVGIQESSYYKWRKRYPEFAARVDAVMAKVRNDRGEAWTGSPQDFERAFIPNPETGEPSQPSYFQQQIYRVLEETAEGDITLLLLPPGSRKTSTVENWSAQKLAIDPDHQILVISESIDQAGKSIGRVKQLLSDTEVAPDLIARFGPFHQHGQERDGKPWGAYQFTIAKKRSSTREYSMQARGWTSQIYGGRAHTIVLDDIQTLKTLGETEKMLRKLRQEVFSRRIRAGRGRVVIVMTRIGDGDIAEALEAEGIPDHVLRLPVVDANGDPLDPELFPSNETDRLRRQVGEEAWASAYMQRPRLGANQTFPQELLDRAKRPAVAARQAPAGWQRLVVVDPTIGAGATAIGALAYSAFKLRPIDLFERYGASSTEEILDLIETYVIRHRPSHVVVEDNNFQAGLARDQRLRAMATRHGFVLAPHHTDATKSMRAYENVMSVSTMVRAFAADEIEIPWHDDGRCELDPGCDGCQVAHADGATRKMFAPLIDEFASWKPLVTGAHLKQDLLMVVWMGWRRWEQLRPREGADDEAWNTGRRWQGTGYRPISRRKEADSGAQR